MFRAGSYTTKSLIHLCKNLNLQRCCSRSLFKRYGYREASGQTLYDELGVDMLASDQDIKIAYLELCKKYHPDSNVEDKSLHEKFVRINAAYNVLSNPKDRKLYDKALQGGLNPEPGEVNTMEDWDPKRPQYYYHPKFYNDPKMREQAAKAWEQNYGYHFPEYYSEGDTKNRNKVDYETKVLGVTICMCALLFSTLLTVRVVLKSRRQIAEHRGEPMYRQYRGNLNKRGAELIRMPDDQSLNDPTPAEKDFPFLYHKEKNE